MGGPGDPPGQGPGAGRAWRRRSFLFGTLGAAGGLLACAGAASQSSPAATPLPLEPLPPGSKLEALGGLVLDTGVIGFGGFSALHVDDALNLTSIADIGRWMTARLVLDGLRPAGLQAVRTGMLRDGTGAPLGRGFAGDAESLAPLPGGGWLVGFERWHRIRDYAALDGPGRYVQAPPEIAASPPNGGMESLAVLPDGRWFIIAENNPWPTPAETRPAWIGGPERWRKRLYLPAPDFDPADMAPLPDGGVLVLERSFSALGGFGSRIVRLTARQLDGEGVMEGEELLRFAPPLPIDNFEGISVFEHGGRRLVALVSDDNQFFLQRSLLLLFALVDD
ncbi:esterase-like activity of phytase family protein [Siccirubricoccus sp. KC 17139]|uniref:Esterase-like activity of phytase family protein n=1 Tax=Siccirubricoccus soli TaxID=2899147 RepID=A0ABT1D0F7_9PROT|nr:esterase-like activity of phytase family protein [Siccirubricoccus soli]MCO6415403.1 esterase-like activity of phytase family protein [Siccirubricoccus soli]MCP2681535.1 esterase-like activity of phytase family protein [Siccirubricoccus soli]